MNRNIRDIAVLVIILALVYFLRKFYREYNEDKKTAESVKEKALIDYKGMRATIREWFKTRDDSLLDQALECADALRTCQRIAEFARPQDIKTRDEALSLTYSKEIAKLLENEQKGFDVDFDFIEGKIELHKILMGYKND